MIRRGYCAYRSREGRRDRGSMAVEVIALLPVLFGFVLLIIAGGKMITVKGEVDSAARDAARAASIARSPGAARAAADDTVKATVAVGGKCAEPAVDTSRFVAGGEVGVTLRCTFTLGDLGLVGLPGTIDIHGTSIAPLDVYRRTA